MSHVEYLTYAHRHILNNNNLHRYQALSSSIFFLLENHTQQYKTARCGFQELDKTVVLR